MWVVVWLRKLWYNNNKINLADWPFLKRSGKNWNLAKKLVLKSSPQLRDNGHNNRGDCLIEDLVLIQLIQDVTFLNYACLCICGDFWIGSGGFI